MIRVKRSTVLSFQVNFRHLHVPALHGTKTVSQQSSLPPLPFPLPSNAFGHVLIAKILEENYEN